MPIAPIRTDPDEPRRSPEGAESTASERSDDIHEARETPVEPSPEAIRVLVVAQSDLARAGLLAAVERETDLRVVGVARSILEASHVLDMLPPAFLPQVILLGSPPPGQVAGLLCRTLVHRVPESRVVVLPTMLDPETLGALLASRVHAVVPAERGPAEVASGVRIAASGSFYLAPTASLLLAGAVQEAIAASSGEWLSPRELAVLDLMRAGCSNPMIAKQLALSHGSVKGAVQAVLRKLGAPGRTVAVATALRIGLLEPDAPHPEHEGPGGRRRPPVEAPPAAEWAPQPWETRVLVVAEGELVRLAVSSTLSCAEDLRVAETGDLSGAQATLDGDPPRVLVAAGLPAGTAISLVQRARARGVSAVVVGSYPPTVRGSVRAAGVIACLDDDVESQHLIDAARTAARLVPTRRRGARLLEPVHDQTPTSRLTRTERLVLRLLVDGMSNADIARDLGVTVPAVKGICARLFEKLGARNRSQAVAAAFRFGMDR